MTARSKKQASPPTKTQASKPATQKPDKKAEVTPPPSRRKPKTREELAEELFATLQATPTGMALLKSIGIQKPKATPPEQKQPAKPKGRPAPPPPPSAPVKRRKKTVEPPPVPPPKKAPATVSKKSLASWQQVEMPPAPPVKKRRTVVKAPPPPKPPTAQEILDAHPLLQAAQWLEKEMHTAEHRQQTLRANKIGSPIRVSMALDLLSFYNVQATDLRKQIKDLKN